MCALFSPEVLETGAVKGLKPSCLWRDTGGDRDPRRCVCVCGGGGGGLDCTQRYTVTTRMTFALRRAAGRAILILQ